MQIDQPVLMHLDIPGCFTGMAGLHSDGMISFIPSGRALTGAELAATLGDEAVILRVWRAPGDERARSPLLLAQVVTTA